MWEALELSGLKEYVESQAGQLDAPVTQMGDNLSLGTPCVFSHVRSTTTPLLGSGDHQEAKDPHPR